jgi:uncharacterized protein (DUF1015 family)
MTAPVVRPFGARVVRQEWASRVVTPMVDARGLGERPRRPRAPAEAYTDSPPALYVYRMGREADAHVGVVADVRVDVFASGDVPGHEAVDPDRVDALVRYYADHPERSEPVALLHGSSPGVTAQVAAVCRTDPLLRFAGEDGVEHTLWRVPEELGTELAAGLDARSCYVADGHHRVAARLRAWERAGRPDGAGVLCLLCPMDGLTLAAFRRRVTGPVSAASVLEAARGGFEVRQVQESNEATGIGLYVGGAWYDLAPTGPRPEGAAGLDAALLQECLLGPALAVTGPDDPRVESHPAHVPLPHVTARCDEDGGALFVLAPPSVATLVRIADRGEVMPPKTTFFSPKPYAGIFLTRATGS